MKGFQNRQMQMEVAPPVPKEPLFPKNLSCSFCANDADVIWKGTTLCKGCLSEKTRTGGL